MPNPFTLVENLLYLVRDAFWNYPDLLVGNKSVYAHISKLYKLSIPYSHFALAIIVFLSSFLIFFGQRTIRVVNADTTEITEAVVMGVDGTGRIQKINRVNPLLPTNIQLEKDLVELIYEPLVKFEFVENEGVWDTVITPFLVNDVVLIKQGADYQFDLRRDVKWHDGVLFTADDVIATFDLVATLPDENTYIRAIKQLRWEKIDDFSVRICTRSNDSEDSCDDITNKPIFSNFLELISIKILPQHKLSDITATTYNTAEPELYRSPVGTGRYEFTGANDLSVTISLNDDYYQGEKRSELKKVTFKYFKTIEDAVTALQNGEAHSLVSTSVQYLRQLEDYKQIIAYKSPILYNQYWAVYFNLKKDPNGTPIAPAFFQDPKIRQAISAAINRQEIIDYALEGVGEEAIGPINARSSFFNPNAKWERYNVDRANILLDQTDWKIRGDDDYRTNSNGVLMEFSLYFVDNFDRYSVARTIQQSLSEVGIKVIIDRKEQPGQDTSDIAPTGWDLKDLSEKVLAPKLFDAVLYGINTFIDPDRFELFHSSQSEHPKLNISSYVGTQETVKPRENRQEGESSLVRLPKVDRLLELTRSFDPVQAKGERKKNYDQVQELIAEDAPVVFLYHPQFVYFANTTLHNVNLHNVATVEDRFRNIELWSLE